MTVFINNALKQITISITKIVRKIHLMIGEWYVSEAGRLGMLNNPYCR